MAGGSGSSTLLWPVPHGNESLFHQKVDQYFAISSVSSFKVRRKPGDLIGKVDPRCRWQKDVATLLDDQGCEKRAFGWVPKIKPRDLVSAAVQFGNTATRSDSLVKLARFQADDHCERAPGWPRLTR
jgi:GDPmannose 4,6-dehydratase